MDRSTRSKLANARKRDYIKEGKKQMVLKKIADTAKNSRFAREQEYEESREDINDDSYIINLDTEGDSGSESIEELPERQPRTTKKAVKRQTRKRNNTPVEPNIEVLKLQHELELLKMQQKKTSKPKSVPQQEVPKQALGATAPIPIPKPVNHRAEAIKNKLLVEF